LVVAQVQDFGPAHPTATDTANSVVWTEESSDDDLDYFAALDVAAAEASPRVVGAEVPGPSVGCRRRRAVAKRRVSEVEGG
jgi:hypothetical protein